MAIHPILVLMPIFGFLVLPCHMDNPLRIVANVTVVKPEDCDRTSLCPPHESCNKTFYDKEKSLCYLISCSQNDSVCENATRIEDLLAKQDSVHVDNRPDGASPPHQSSGNSSQDDSSANHTQPLKPTVNISSTSIPMNPPSLPNVSTTTVSTKLQTTPSNQSAESEDVPGGVIPATIPTTPANTSIPTITPTTTATTTKPSTTSTSTTVAQTTAPQQPSSPSPSKTKTSANTSPLVPTTPPPIPSTKPVQPSPVPTSTKPSPTTTKTSTHPSVVPSTLTVENRDQSRTDQTKVEVAGDPLTIHLLNTSSLLAVLMFGLLFFVVTVALFVKQAYESYRRKDYTQVDYLINGMYSDSGV